MLLMAWMFACLGIFQALAMATLGPGGFGPARPGSQGHTTTTLDLFPSNACISPTVLMHAPSQSSDSRWARLPEQAAEQPDGGPRSFPEAKERKLLEYTYNAPTEQYQRLFFRMTAGSSSSLSDGHSAGWLIPDDMTECNPVFVAHSTLAAIWLLRETLPKDTLPDAGWEHLAHGAYLLSQDAGEEIPPPAQTPRRSPSPLAKRPAPTGQTPTPKRARTEQESDDPGPSSPASPPPEPSPPRASTGEMDAPSEGTDAEEEQPLAITVTNNNLLAEKRREEERKKRDLERRESLGLTAPHKADPPTEHAAYASISRKDEHFVSWIFKQSVGDADFYQTARSPYATATSMLDKARALGKPSTYYHAASFLQSWRSQGTPFSTRTTAPASSSQATRTSSGLAKALPWPRNDNSSQPNAISSAFRRAWDTLNHYERELALVNVQYRWAMAFLARAYADKITLLEREDQLAGRGERRSRSGKGNLRTEARNALLPLVCNTITEREKGIFKKRLQRATR